MLLFSHMQVKNGIKTNQFFWDVCGHNQLTDYLKSYIVSGQVSHAYIFAGGKNLGKKTTAAKFIKTLFCQGQGEYRPCNNCPACHQVENRIHPDVYYLRRLPDEKSGRLKRDITVEQIRELKSKLAQSTLLRSWKIAVIEEAEALNANSANSLLKVLEEPTARTVIILITSDISRLPKTIVSRSLVLNFLPVKREEIRDYLLSRDLSEEKAEKISRLALGRPGRAIVLMEDSELLGEVYRHYDDFAGLFAATLPQRLKTFETLVVWEKDESINQRKLISLIEDWQAALRDLMLSLCGNQADLSSLRVEKIIATQTIGWGRILNTDRLLAEAKKMFEANISSKNILENLLINL